MAADRVLIGALPAPADGYLRRQATWQILSAALVPGGAAALVPAARATAIGADGGAAATRRWQDSCGRTELAAASAISLWERGDVEVLVWLTATSRASVLSAFAEAGTAARTGPSAGANPAAAPDAEQAARQFTGWLRDTARPWLVVLDNLDDPSVMDELWPTGPAGRVLITTTSPAALPTGPAIIGVGAFDQREALSYLMGRLATDLDQRQGAIDLVSDLGGEPLALAQASAVIASSELTCHQYREHFALRREQLIGATAGEPPAASITWALSVEHADLLAPGTAHPLLMLASLLDGTGIPATVFGTKAARDYCGSGSGQDPLTALAQAGLIEIDPDPASAMPLIVRMSWPVQAATRSAMPRGLLAEATRAAADALVQAWPRAGLAQWQARALRSCADCLRRVAGDLLWQDGPHELLLRAADSLDDARLTKSAVELWSELADAGDRVLGPSHPDAVQIRDRLAKANLAAGRWPESIAWFHQVKQDRTVEFGRDHPATIKASRDLSQALLAARRFTEATGVLAEVVSAFERSLGPGSIEALAAREELAAAYRGAGKYPEAIRLYRGVLTERERRQGPRHHDTAATRQKLADTYLADGQGRAAISHYKRVLADAERTLGPEHPDTIAARGALGAAYLSTGRMAPALALYEQTRAEYARVLGTDHRTTLATSRNLAEAYFAVGRVTDATRLITDTAERVAATLPAADQLAAAVRQSLGDIVG